VDYQVPVVPLTILQPLALAAPEVSHVRDTVPFGQRMYAYLTPDFDVMFTSYELVALGVPTTVAP
jgi:hypothetical protein